jgi:hypothetical protein
MYRPTLATTTTRSFDLLIRDFASINLRQHRARTFLLHHHSRRDFHAGSTEPLRFHVEANELGDKRWRDEGVGLKITGYKDEDGVKVGDAIPLELDEGDGKWRQDGWAAEVDVVAPEGLVAAMPGESVVVEAGVSTPVAEEMAVDGAVTVGAAATGASVAGHSAAGGSKSRAESRLARRQRRELAGSYKPDAAAREQQTEQKQRLIHDRKDGRPSIAQAKRQGSYISPIEREKGRKERRAYRCENGRERLSVKRSRSSPQIQRLQEHQRLQQHGQNTPRRQT